MIHKKPSGILSILDEQCLLGQCCNNRTFISSVYDNCSTHTSSSANMKQKAKGIFTIHHYAGPVVYNSKLFLVNNKDEFPKESKELLINSNNLFIQYLDTILIGIDNTSSSSLLRTSVGIKFTFQLHQLQIRINSNYPHYVHCLKPNDDLLLNIFNCDVIVNQLRCGGILEDIRVSRIGFPQRYSHKRFLC